MYNIAAVNLHSVNRIGVSQHSNVCTILTDLNSWVNLF